MFSLGKRRKFVVKGRLVHVDPMHRVLDASTLSPDGEDEPLSFQVVGLFLDRVVGPDLELCTTTTDRNGEFTAFFNSRRVGGDEEKIEVKVYEERQKNQTSFRILQNDMRIIHEENVDCDFVKQENWFDETTGKRHGEVRFCELEPMRVELYEYQPDLPNIRFPAKERYLPQEFTNLNTAHFYGAVIPGTVQELLSRVGNGVAEIQEIFDTFNRTNHELEVSPESTIDMILNGVFPCHFLKKLDRSAGPHTQVVDPTAYVCDVNWDGYEFDRRGNPQLPNASLTARKDADGRLVVEYVDVCFREQMSETDDSRPETRRYQNPAFPTPDGADGASDVDRSVSDDADEFLGALHVFNSAAALKGEVTSHLGVAHLWTGQVAMALFRCVNANPIRDLLGPHMREVLVINHKGESAIFGKTGILNVSGLTEGSIKQALIDCLGSLDYTNFSPRAVMHDGQHRFAKAEQLFWGTVTRLVDAYFVENAEGIQEHWYEIYRMSNNLVSHSVDFRPLDGIEIPESKDDVDEAVRIPWHDTNELELREYGNRVADKAVRPITWTEADPTAEDMERLKQFCRYSIFIAVFHHSVVHNSQKVLAKMNFATLAPRFNGRKEDNPDAWHKFLSTKPKNARRQLAITSILLRYQGAHLLENPNRDVSPLLLDEVEATAGDYEALGYDPEIMYYAVTI